MELISAARRALMSDPTVRGYVQDRVFKYRLEQSLDGTGQSAVVLTQDGGWTQPDRRNTSRFPLLVVRCYSDSTRDLTGLVTTADAEDRAMALQRAVDRFLTRVKVSGERWGVTATSTGLQVIDVQLWSDPILVTNDDGHDDTGPLALGDVVYWQTAYAMTVTY